MNLFKPVHGVRFPSQALCLPSPPVHLNVRLLPFEEFCLHSGSSRTPPESLGPGSCSSQCQSLVTSRLVAEHKRMQTDVAPPPQRPDLVDPRSKLIQDHPGCHSASVQNLDLNLSCPDGFRARRLLVSGSVARSRFAVLGFGGQLPQSAVHMGFRAQLC